MNREDPHVAELPASTDPETVISTDGFLQLLKTASLGFLSLVDSAIAVDVRRWPRMFFAEVTAHAHKIETFFDDYGARNNRRFSFLAELTASVRGFGATAALLSHIKVRLSSYSLCYTKTETSGFHDSLIEATDLTLRSLRELLIAIRAEAEKLGIGSATVPMGLGQAEYPNEVKRKLPHDINVEEVASAESIGASVLADYLNILERLRAVRLPQQDLESLTRFMASDYQEEMARELQSNVNNLQSAYDTHIKTTKLEQKHPDLRTFRGHVSLALHLFEVGTLLVHFLERHEDIIQTNPAKERIARIVNKLDVLRTAILFAHHEGRRALLSVKPIVDRLLTELTERHEIDVEVPEDGILHARPLSLIVRIVQHHDTPIEIIIDGEAQSASSIMSLIIFIGRHAEAKRISFRGDRKALDDIAILFKSGLGEGDLSKLPSSLAYLRS